jgi:thioredoxin
MKDLNSENFKELTNSGDKPVAVMVTASWCPNCKALAPVFETAAEDLEKSANFYSLMVDDNQELAKSIKIMGVPTILFYRHGVLISKKLGNQSLLKIKQIVDAMVGLSPEDANNKEYRSFFSRIFRSK